jgi:hypothetical protein
MSGTDIAAETARSVQAVEQWLVLDSASDEVKAIVRAGEVEAQAAITLVRQHGPHAQHALKEMLQRIRNDIAARAPAEDAANDPATEGTKEPRKTKPAKVTVRAMRELKTKEVALSAAQVREVAAAINVFATEIGSDVLLDELRELDAANDDLYSLDIEAHVLRKVMEAWALLRPPAPCRARSVPRRVRPPQTPVLPSPRHSHAAQLRACRKRCSPAPGKCRAA